MVPLVKAQMLDSHDKEWLRAVREIVLRYAPDATLILYGSAARGTRTPESDYDIIVLTPQPLPPRIQDDMRGAIYDMELLHGVVLSLLFLACADWERLRTARH
ncbi:MAG: nucleotidyltransferase domain-containing protein, partial [Armatimonadota bacterium]|nr:nucleotidyltransferase domain-containing protein [bacterium]MDW8321624.1 nucleotidyltransferase domain-containing protein [Armatimonadota bacterium]